MAPSARSRLPSLYVTFFLSGGAALGYEIVWTRQFAFSLGHEMPSLLAVVAAYFGGFGLGAALLDNKISRSGHPGRWYAILELIVGCWAILSIPLIPVCNHAAIHLIGPDPSAWRHWLVAFSIPAIILLPATAAMGATLPAMERLVARLENSGKTVSGLYAANTAGAVAGTLFATFSLIPSLGFTAALVVLASINLLCAAAVGFVRTGGTSEIPRTEAKLSGTPRTRRLIALLFFTGILGIGYEVVCVRAMAQVFENTVYSFASALSVFLLGSAFGAALYHKFLRSAPFRFPLALFLQFLALFSLLGLVVLEHLGPIHQSLREWLGRGFAGSILAEMLAAFTVFLLPTMLMGALFSHLAIAARKPTGGIGHALGVNTLGASLAPLVFGVILVTQIGIRWSLLLIAASYLLLVFLVPRLKPLWLFPVMAILPLFFLAPTTVIHLDLEPGQHIRRFHEGVAASVAVVENRQGHRQLKVNNHFAMGSTFPTFSERRLAHIPLLLHESPRSVLFLGVGTGVTAGEATTHPGVEVTGVELLPEILDVLPLFAPANRLDAVPQGSYVAADARRFVNATARTYDVIVGDLFHPSRDGAGMLYTEEHFRSVRTRLSEGGLFCQWLPLFQLDEETVRLIVRTFLAVFPDATAHLAHFNPETMALGLFGGSTHREYDGAWYERRVTDEALSRELESAALSNAFTLFGTLAAGSEDLKRWAGKGIINTDDRPLAMFGAPRFTYRNDGSDMSHAVIGSLLDGCNPAAKDLLMSAATIEGKLFAGRLDRYLEARDLYLRAMIGFDAGRHREAVEGLLESAITSCDFRTAYMVCLEVVRQIRDEETRRSVLRALQDACPGEPSMPVR